MAVNSGSFSHMANLSKRSPLTLSLMFQGQGISLETETWLPPLLNGF